MKIYSSQEWVEEQLEKILPAITTEDNGKVLMVVDGKLQLVAINLSVDENGVVSV